MVPRSFWQISLAGNILLLLHTFIQVQYHLCLFQAFNAVISWRNLNLMQTRRPPASFHYVWFLLIAATLAVTGAFALQDWLLARPADWFRIPTAPWHSSPSKHISLAWHLIGTLGYLLFSSRFWIQWWLTEKAHTSLLPLSFWWLSLSGTFLSIGYFMRIGDIVHLIGPLIGLVPYVRNLMLLQRMKDSPQKL